MKTLIYILLFCLSGYATFAQATETSKIDKNLKKQFDKLLQSYYNIKDALVEGEHAEASKSAAEFNTSLAKIDMGKLNQSQKDFWKKQSEKLKISAAAIENAQEIEKQRDEFELLTLPMLSIIKTLKINSSPVYQQYCPMAFNSKGAFWLSNEKQVLNPYFGKKMLHCGSVKGEF